MPRAHANGIDIEYESIGEGEPLLLIMGIGAQLVHWPEDFCAMLAARGFRVIRYDNRDVGLSSRLDDLRVPPMRTTVWRGFLGLPIEAPYTLSDMAADAAALLDELGIDRAHVLGVSMGGMIAQTLAIEHPERVRTLTSLMSTTGDRRHVIGHPRALAALLGPAPRSRDQAADRAVDFLRATGSTRFEIDYDDARRRAALAYERCFYPRGFARHLAAIVASGSRTRALASISAPTLVLHGSVDRLLPPAGGRATARAIPGARFRLIEGMGHHLPRGAWPIIVNHFTSLAAG